MHDAASMTSPEPSNPASAVDCLRNALADMRASRNEFHAIVSGALANIEQMGDTLLTRPTQSEHEVLERQTTRLAAVVAELIDFFADQKQMAAEERMGLAKESRQALAQLDAFL
jgi:hypothetical protein